VSCKLAPVWKRVSYVLYGDLGVLHEGLGVLCEGLVVLVKA
jgi:hypothetical protein